MVIFRKPSKVYTKALLDLYLLKALSTSIRMSVDLYLYISLFQYFDSSVLYFDIKKKTLTKIVYEKIL